MHVMIQSDLSCVGQLQYINPCALAFAKSLRHQDQAMAKKAQQAKKFVKITIDDTTDADVNIVELSLKKPVTHRTLVRTIESYTCQGYLRDKTLFTGGKEVRQMIDCLELRLKTALGLGIRLWAIYTQVYYIWWKIHGMFLNSFLPLQVKKDITKNCRVKVISLAQMKQQHIFYNMMGEKMAAGAIHPERTILHGRGVDTEHVVG